MKNKEVMPIELENSRTAAVNLLFECTKNLLLTYSVPDQEDLTDNEKEVMFID